MVIVGEKGTEHAVHQAGCKDFIVACASFALEEAAGETAAAENFSLYSTVKGHEVNSFAGFFGRYDGGKEHGVAHTHFDRSISLLCQLAGLDSNLSAVGKSDGFFNYVHKVFIFYRLNIRAKIRFFCGIPNKYLYGSLGASP